MSKTQTLVREDWDDISKLRFRELKGTIIDAKVFNTTGSVECPVMVHVVVDDTDHIWEYSIEGLRYFSEDKSDIIKVDDNKYFNTLMTIMKNSLPIKQVIMGWHSAWYLITEVDNNNQVFHTRKSMMNFSDIETFVILINNQEMSFKDFADSRPMSLKDILNSTTKE
jgi:hypothetical protein